MFLKKIILCCVTAVLIMVVTACSQRPAGQHETADTENEENHKTENGAENMAENSVFTLDSTVRDVISDSAFRDFGRLLFPVNRTVSEDATLSEISSEDVYVWYSDIQPEKTVEIVNHLKARADSGENVFFLFIRIKKSLRMCQRRTLGYFTLGVIQEENLPL